MITRPIRRALLTALLAVAAGCHHGGTQREPDEYLGCATDETWASADSAEVAGIKVDDSQAPPITAPTEGAMLPSANAPAFTWQLSANAPGRAPGTASCDKCANCGPLATMHEPAVSGDLFDLQFSVDGALVWRVLGTRQDYVPSAGMLSALRGKTASLKLLRMSLKVNDVTDGPFAAAKPLTFSVAN